LASIIFFNYRSKKLKEAGYKWVEDMKKKHNWKIRFKKD
jgi:hypothetical protein